LAIASVAKGEEADTQAAKVTTAESGFVGTWRVVVTNPDGSAFPVLASFLADGATIHEGPITQPAAPGAPNAVVFQSAGNGVWEATGETSSALTFEVLTGDERGTFLGRVTVGGVQTLDPGEDSFTGRYVITISDPTGEIVAEIPTTAQGERMHLAVPQSIAGPAAPSGRGGGPISPVMMPGSNIADM